jgi:SAM-dependent methyltransferase
VKDSVDFYDSHYDRVNDAVYRSIRLATYGDDLGQASWITAEECQRFCRALGIRPEHRVLEVACGSGGVAVHIAETTGAEVVGVDINAFAVRAAQRREPPPQVRVPPEFLLADADSALPFPDQSFDFVFCNDSSNHFHDRLQVLRDWRRLLRAGGRCLYTDPVVVTGLVSNADLAARSALGFFLFSGPGANEALLVRAGMRVIQVVDVTDGLVQTSSRWRIARQTQRAALIDLEGESTFEGLQRFLDVVHALGQDRRLSRIACLAERVEGAV